MRKYAIAPDYPSRNLSVPFFPLILRLAYPVQSLVWKLAKPGRGICVERYSVPGYKDLPVPVEVYRPEGASCKLPCLLYLHGGGFGFMTAPYQKRQLCRYALELGCAVVFPDYHLLPAYPFPAARDDVLAVYCWVHHMAEQLRVDTDHVAVGGDSAGGALAAYVTNLAQERGCQTPCFQLLIYPVADAAMDTASMAAFPDTPFWNATQNRRMWKMYLRDVPETEKPGASPMAQPLPEKLPKTYLETAEFDCLRDEGKAYGERLYSAGADVTIIETKGTVHGYDVVQQSNITREIFIQRVQALKEGFHK